MSSPDSIDLNALLGEVSRAPSAHNVQPARWRRSGDSIELFEDLGRRLPHADPTGKDGRVSLGAAWEGMVLALSRRGWTLSSPELFPLEYGASSSSTGVDAVPVPVARATLSPGATVDPLADLVDRRHTFRGTFETNQDASARLIDWVRAREDVSLIADRDAITRWARLHDEASYRFLCDPAYQAELYDWLRFTPTHRYWDRDGLTAPCLGMSAVEARFARSLFKPVVFRMLKGAGLGRLAVAEASATKSATALVVLQGSANPDWFEAGRRLYRVWLELTDLGLSACPMSSLADDDAARTVILDELGLPEATAVVNVLRVGPTPARDVARSPRLPLEELMV